MPNNTIGWGQAAANNSNGFGAAAQNNNINWGWIHSRSYGHDETNLVGPPGFDEDYQAVLDYATTQGYILPSESQQAIQNALVLDLKSTGVWSGLDFFNVFATDGDSNYALIDWINLTTGTAVNSPTFTTNLGFTGDGVSAYIDTGYTISANLGSSNYQQNDASTFTHYVSDLTQTDAAAYGFRNDQSTRNRNQLRLRDVDYRPAINDNRIIISTDYRSNNWHHQRRDNSANFTTYLDSTSIVNTITSDNPTLLNASMHLLVNHLRLSSGQLINLFPSKGTIKIFGMGSALTNSHLKTAIDNYLSAI